MAFAEMPLRSDSAIPQAKVTIRGKKPIAWLNNEWEWREVLAEQGQKTREQSAHQEVSKTTHFSVEVVFFLNDTNIERVDFDNLAKPLFDTLFRLRRPQVKDLNLAGALFDVDDDRVYKEQKP
jgi:hypothetical protein